MFYNFKLNSYVCNCKNNVNLYNFICDLCFNNMSLINNNNLNKCEYCNKNFIGIKSFQCKCGFNILINNNNINNILCTNCNNQYYIFFNCSCNEKKNKNEIILLCNYCNNLKKFNKNKNNFYMNSKEFLNLNSSLFNFKNNIENKLNIDENNSIWAIENVPFCSILNEKNSILTGHSNGTINLWDLNNKIPFKKYNEHISKVFDIKFFNRNYFISCSEDKNIKIWNLSNEKSIFTFSNDSENYCIYLYNKNLFVGDKNGNFNLFLIEENNDQIKINLINKINSNHNDLIWRIKLLKNNFGEFLISGSKNSLILHKFNNIENNLIFKLKYNNNVPNKLIFDIEILNKNIFISCCENLIKIWNFLYKNPIYVIDNIFNNSIYSIKYLEQFSNQKEKIVVFGGIEKKFYVFKFYISEKIIIDKLYEINGEDEIYKIINLFNCNCNFNFATINYGKNNYFYLLGNQNSK